MELVDTLDLKSNGYYNGRAGSSPARGTCPIFCKEYRVFLWGLSFGYNVVTSRYLPTNIHLNCTISLGSGDPRRQSLICY